MVLAVRPVFIYGEVASVAIWAKLVQETPVHLSIWYSVIPVVEEAVHESVICGMSLAEQLAVTLSRTGVAGGTGSVVTVTELVQALVIDWLSDITVTLPVFVPAVEYDFDTDAVVPERLSVPDHEYIYDPIPPETVEDQITDWPVLVVVGETLQEAVRGGGGVT